MNPVFLTLYNNDKLLEIYYKAGDRIMCEDNRKQGNMGK